MSMHPHIICRYPLETYRCTWKLTDVWGYLNVWGVQMPPKSDNPHACLKSRNINCLGVKYVYCLKMSETSIVLEQKLCKMPIVIEQ